MKKIYLLLPIVSVMTLASCAPGANLKYAAQELNKISKMHENVDNFKLFSCKKVSDIDGVKTTTELIAYKQQAFAYWKTTSGKNIIEDAITVESTWNDATNSTDYYIVKYHIENGENLQKTIEHPEETFEVFYELFKEVDICKTLLIAIPSETTKMAQSFEDISNSGYSASAGASIGHLTATMSKGKKNNDGYENYTLEAYNRLVKNYNYSSVKNGVKTTNKYSYNFNLPHTKVYIGGVNIW